MGQMDYRHNSLDALRLPRRDVVVWGRVIKSKVIRG